MARKGRCRLILILVLVVSAYVMITAASVSAGTTYYVSPAGNNAGDGSRSQPWATIAKAVSQAQPGDTVIFLPGEYEEILRPVRSGTIDAPITFMPETPHSVRLLGTSGSEAVVVLAKVAHIRIADFHITPKSSTAGWIRVENARHIAIENNIMEYGANARLPFYVVGSEQVGITDNIIRRLPPQGASLTLRPNEDIIRVDTSRHILFAGNVIGGSLHTAISFYPRASNEYIVMRNNILINTWGRAFEFFTARHVLLDGNIVTGAYQGAMGGARSKLRVDHGIVRRNVMFRNWDSPFALFTDADSDLDIIEHVRIYNNVFYENVKTGLEISISPYINDIVVQNNVMGNNDALGTGTQLTLRGQNTGQVRFRNNALSGILELDPRLVDYDNIWGSQANAELGFLAAERNDFSLDNASALRDGGAALTKTRGNGNGKVLPVEDAYGFYDGFGIVGEVGDLIQVGDASQTARVVAIDYENRLLTLDREVTWQDGMPVGLPWSGSAPDIGVYEMDDDLTATVKVELSAATLQVGTPLRLTALTQGIDDIIQYDWSLGDGGPAVYGREVTHVYTDPGLYPIIVKVLDADGEVHYGLQVVEVVAAEGGPLLHSSFDRNDTSWWWRWRFQPGYTKNNRLVVTSAAGDGYIRVNGSAADSTLYTDIQVPNWDIDQYPYLYVRYRIMQGTPLALQLDTFVGRTFILAATYDHTDTRLSNVGGQLLFNDGQWHELCIDVRTVRSLMPELKMAYGVSFNQGTQMVGPNDSYQLDEVIIDSVPVSTLAAGLKITPMSESTVGVRQLPFAISEQLTADDAVQSVIIRLNGAPVYEAATIPDTWTLDTSTLANGRHLVTLHVTLADGRSASTGVTLQLNNHWIMTDDFAPKVESAWFGSVGGTTAILQSTNWRYDTDQPTHFFYDDTRYTPTGNDEGFLIWEAPLLESYELVLYGPTADVTDLIRLEVSDDAGGWRRVPFSQVQTEQGASGWLKATIKGTVPESTSDAYFRITVLPAVGERVLQLGKLTLVGWRDE
ncbi:MAG TPA: PKD domain-containing protein [Firmicutes bacterium]|nr:PKD domain-containing protein [Bacillota bacterium]